MARINASQLVQNLIQPPSRGGIRFFLCDDPIFPHLARQALHKVAPEGQVFSFSGKEAISECVAHVSTGSLFGSPAPAIVELGAITAAQWKTALKDLERLPGSLDVAVDVFAGTAARSVVKEADAERFGSYALCYSPDDAEARKTVLILINRFPRLRALDATARQKIADSALSYYAVDLLSIDQHLDRMERLGVNFEEALLGQTEITAFHVLDALVACDVAQIELRVRQCELSGEEPGRIFQAVVFFLRQVVQVAGELQQSNNYDAAFRAANVPYPAQARVRKALSGIPMRNIIRFFFVAPELELTLRGQRGGYEWISNELQGLCSQK